MKDNMILRGFAQVETARAAIYVVAWTIGCASALRTRRVRAKAKTGTSRAMVRTKVLEADAGRVVATIDKQIAPKVRMEAKAMVKAMGEIRVAAKGW